MLPEGQFDDAVRSLADKFKGDISTHRQAGQRKMRRRRLQRPLDHGRKIGVRHRIDNSDRRNVAQITALMGPQSRIAQQPRNHQKWNFLHDFTAPLDIHG